MLHDNCALHELQNDVDEMSAYAESFRQQVLNHSVVELMVQRYHQGSTPSNRTDTHKLALSIEGGGMRGAVSAGMAAALSSLGLTDTIDAVYGSSAGSVVGAYLVSRQMSLDVYYNILPNAKKTFVCKQRMIGSLVRNAIRYAVSGMFGVHSSPRAPPGMNISFVLDGIMDSTTGCRPLDAEAFARYDAIQPLRVVASCVWSNGTLDTKCFGAEDYPHVSSSNRRGLFACLEASMTVPGATGPPVYIDFHNDKSERGHQAKSTTTAGMDNPSQSGCFFDAFCFEPLPYRSAVEEGATHVLALQTRPAGYNAKTQPTLYEKGIAPLYFHSHRQPAVAKFFQNGGQQYRYLEDYLTMEHGQQSLREPIPVPPVDLQYGCADNDDGSDTIHRDTTQWRTAHILPVAVPRNTPELPTLENDPVRVLEAVRQGFAAAYNVFAPALGLDNPGMDGMATARELFPDELLQSSTTPTVTLADKRLY